MKKTLLLLAGYPGTGKTYFGNMFLKEQKDFYFVSQDKIKENIFDELGFNNIEEKSEVIEIGRKRYYQEIENFMKKNKSIISDYPFSYKQRPIFEALAKKYNYQIITIRFVGNIRQIYERQRARDLDPSRHLGHMSDCYHLGDISIDRTKQGDLVTFEQFVDRGKDRGYDTFCLGNLIEIDTTDFNKVDYPKVIRQLKELID